jgi:hypothetical protein
MRHCPIFPLFSKGQIGSPLSRLATGSKIDQLANATGGRWQGSRVMNAKNKVASQMKRADL